MDDSSYDGVNTIVPSVMSDLSVPDDPSLPGFFFDDPSGRAPPPLANAHPSGTKPRSEHTPISTTMTTTIDNGKRLAAPAPKANTSRTTAVTTGGDDTNENRMTASALEEPMHVFDMVALTNAVAGTNSAVEQDGHSIAASEQNRRPSMESASLKSAKTTASTITSPKVDTSYCPIVTFVPTKYRVNVMVAGSSGAGMYD
jgi:hypothetical protein